MQESKEEQAKISLENRYDVKWCKNPKAIEDIVPKVIDCRKELMDCIRKGNNARVCFQSQPCQCQRSPIARKKCEEKEQAVEAEDLQASEPSSRRYNGHVRLSAEDWAERGSLFTKTSGACRRQIADALCRSEGNQRRPSARHSQRDPRGPTLAAALMSPRLSKIDPRSR